MLGFTRNTIAELFDRKVIWVYVVVTLITMLIVVMSGSLRLQVEGALDPSMGEDGVNQMLRNPYLMILNGFLGFMVFLSVLATASIVPSKLKKGQVDYYLSKPYSRVTFLVQQYLSIFITYSLLIVATTVLVVLTGLIIHGLIDYAFLKLLFLHLLVFGIWLTVSMFGAIAFGTTVVSLMTVFLIWIAQTVLKFHEGVEQLINSKLITSIVTGLYYIFPKTGQIEDLAANWAINNQFSEVMPLYTSLLFGVVLYVITIIIFKRKNY